MHGIKDTCSDDHLWIVPTILNYVKETGDMAFIDQVIPYADGGDATVYQHMMAALDFPLNTWVKTGICKGLRADWNDCLNLAVVNRRWCLFFTSGHQKHSSNCLDSVTMKRPPINTKPWLTSARAACETHLWDEQGQWYIRGLTKDGDKIGTFDQVEGKVHLESNSLAVLSGAVSQRTWHQSHGCSV
ncbi:GH36-type glycosyl hydrolase domain-containing protein [Vibrio metschnikovii]